MPRFKQDHPKQIPNLMPNFCVMTSHLPQRLPHMTLQLNETLSPGKLQQKKLIKNFIKTNIITFSGYWN